METILINIVVEQIELAETESLNPFYIMETILISVVENYFNLQCLVSLNPFYIMETILISSATIWHYSGKSGTVLIHSTSWKLFWL